MTQLTIIVAYDASRGIGIDNQLPWRLPEDLARFKQITTGHAIIMGRKTFESIGRPLPNRRNIVLSRDHDWRRDGVEVVSSLQSAIQLIKGNEAFIIGGAAIFEQALPLCSKLLVTEIHHKFVCDTFFPVIDKAQWQEKERTTHYSEKSELEYAFVTYCRRGYYE